MTTLNKINRAISLLGDISLVRGNGYYYFIGASVECCAGTSVMVFRLNELTHEQWIEEAKRLIEENNSKK